MTLPRSASVEAGISAALIHRPMVVVIPVLRRFKRRPIARSVTGGRLPPVVLVPVVSRNFTSGNFSTGPTSRSIGGLDIELGGIKAEPPHRDRRCHCFERIVERSPAMLLMLEALDRAAVLRAGRGPAYRTPATLGSSAGMRLDAKRSLLHRIFRFKSRRAPIGLEPPVAGNGHLS